jgi:hypothetical protein
MKLPKELYNGVIILIGISLYFMLMEILGLANLYYLRVFNVLFVFYGTNRTLRMNYKQGKNLFASNAFSALTTSLLGVFLSVLALIAYSYFQGGDAYLQSLSKTFLFGGDPSIMTYSISLLFEGIVSAVIISFMLLLYWDNLLKND